MSKLTHIWLRPRSTIRGIVDSNPSEWVIPLAALNGAVWYFARVAAIVIPEEQTPILVTAIRGAIWGSLGGILSLFVFGVTMAWTGRRLGGVGRPIEVRAAYAWGRIPAIFGGVVRSLSVVTGLTHPVIVPAASGIWGGINAALNPGTDPQLVSVILWTLDIWSWILILLCVAETHQFSFWRAVGSLLLLLGIATALGLAVVAGLLFGWTFYWPLLGTILSGFVAWCLVRNPVRRPMIPALAIQGGQLLWLLLGLFVVFLGNIRATDMPATAVESFPAGQLVDAGLMAAFILWVAYRPGIVAGVLVGIYQLSSLIVHASELSATLKPADMHGLIMHMTLNFSIVVLLFIGLIRIRSSVGSAPSLITSTLTQSAHRRE